MGVVGRSVPPLLFCFGLNGPTVEGGGYRGGAQRDVCKCVGVGG